MSVKLVVLLVLQCFGSLEFLQKIRNAKQGQFFRMCSVMLVCVCWLCWQGLAMMKS